MKTSLYYIALFLFVLWAILYFGLDAFGFVHILLIMAGFIVILKILSNKKLSHK